MITFSQLARITGGKVLQLVKDCPLEALLLDSRKAVVSDGNLFFAIHGERHDGHQYIQELYERGIRNFVVERAFVMASLPEANIIQVPSSVKALQQLVIEHRKKFSIPVIAITGSNGKTIVKEWLYQLLSTEYTIVKNPGSYNSQIGVPLSVWPIQSFHQLGIFEAGLSTAGEMEVLNQIIRPTIGLFTNIGTAHDEGFSSHEEKVREKLKLFQGVEILIYRSDQPLVSQLIRESGIHSLCWGSDSSADIFVESQDGFYELTFEKKKYSLTIPFTDAASFENCLHCVAIMLYLNYPADVIQKRIGHLKSISMRLEMKPGINGCQLIDDTYNNDLEGLRISLDFLQGQPRKKKTLILSDIFQSGLTEQQLMDRIRHRVEGKSITRLLAIGDVLNRHSQMLNGAADQILTFATTEDFLKELSTFHFQDELVLIKGARVFQFEKIVLALQAKVHGTVMEIDLNKVVHNLNYFRSKLEPGVKLMVMVKALAYGSGSEQIASLLQYHKVDYLGVAYTDEGADLRKNQIALPIMVMNPSSESFDTVLNFQLEPVMYQLKLLREWVQFLNGRQAKVHIELDTGMHRLGLDEEDIPALLQILREHKNLEVMSVFSHLAGADEEEHDTFTQAQAERFTKMYDQIVSVLHKQPMRHILNSPGQIRHQQYQWEMVRLGIGLYGFNPTDEKISGLKPAIALKTIVSQVKLIQPGESIGYGRKGKAEKEMKLATIAIGYADGFSRSFSQGKGSVWINGKLAPVVGNVCMDMTMVDVTNIPVQEGDEVLIFGDQLPVHQVATSINTIPYEILTSTSDRVKRVFFADSI